MRWNLKEARTAKRYAEEHEAHQAVTLGEMAKLIKARY